MFKLSSIDYTGLYSNEEEKLQAEENTGAAQETTEEQDKQELKKLVAKYG